MKKYFTLLISVLSWGLSAQTIYTMPTNGTTDTAEACSGFLVDAGGLNGNYTTYNNGYYIIKPPTGEVSLTFSSFDMYHSSDFVQIWDGEGTSSTYVGFYTGTSLPNSGNAIVSTNGALTVRFYSNYFGNAAGFLASWSSTDTVAPSANFSQTTTTQNYNTPIQFLNTTSNGGSYLWDFGDGTTSTLEHPSHAFTSAGSNTVTLIATNCASSDTVTKTITIASAPSLQPYTDPITMSLACGTIATEYWTLSNGSNAGVFTADFQTFDTSGVERITFDNSLGGASMQSGTATYTRVTDAAQGSHSLQYSNAGSSNVLEIPLDKSGPGFQPTYFSYRTKATSSGWRAGKFQMSSGNTFAPSVLGYTFWYGTGQIGIRRKMLSGSLGFDYVTKTSGSWVHIEYKNIDWTAETFDLYIDGTFYNKYSFLNPTSNTSADYVSHLRLVNDYSSDVALIDDIQIGDGPANSNLTISPTATTILGGNSATMSLSYDATGLSAGTYYSFLAVQSNDTTINGDTLEVEVTITGDYTFAPVEDTLNVGSIPTGQWHQDSLWITNPGCKLIDVDSISSTYSSFIGQLADVASYDTSTLYFEINPTTAGSLTVPVDIYVTDSMYTVYITATVYDATSIAFDSTEISIARTGCFDTIMVPFWVYNDGQDSLNWEFEQKNLSLFDDFEGTSINTKIWDTFGSGANMGGSCGQISGSQSLLFYGASQREATTKPLNLSSATTIEFDLGQSLCNYASSWEGIYTDYSTDGVTWTNLNYTHTYSLQTAVSINLPDDAKTPNTRIRFKQLYYSSSVQDHMLLDNLQINGGIFDNLTTSPVSGTVAVGDSQQVYVVLTTDSLQTGSYEFLGLITSDDPVDSVVELTINLDLAGRSETFIDQMGCLSLDTLVAGEIYSDSLLLTNIGCDSLTISSFTSSSTNWTLSASDAQIFVYDSSTLSMRFSRSTTGIIQDTLFVATSDTTWPICVSGYVVDAPEAWVDDSQITLTTQGCGDSVAFSFTLGNAMDSTSLDWSLNLGKSLNVLIMKKHAFPVLVTNLKLFLNQHSGVTVREANSITDGVNQLDWADVVIFAPVTANSVQTAYTNYQSDFEDFVEDGGKMVVMGSPYVGRVLAMNWIGAYYQGNYTGYNQYFYSWQSNGYLDQVPLNNFVAPSTTYAVRFYSSPYNYHVYYSSSYQTFVRADRGDGEVLYIGYSFLTSSPQFEQIFTNILDKSLDEKPDDVNWLTTSVLSGTTSGGDTTTITGMAYSDSLVAGVYNKSIQVITNDPLRPTLSIPVEFTVLGEGELTLDQGCQDFGDVFQQFTVSNDIALYNTGCDSLFVLSSATGGSSFSSGQLDTIKIGPSDTASISVALTHASVATVNDTLFLYTTTDTVSKCLTASIIGAPIVSASPDTIALTVNKCVGTDTADYTIENTGDGVLNFSVEVAEIYDSTSIQNWVFGAPNYSNRVDHYFNGIIDSDTLFLEIILNGEFSQSNNYFYLYANGSYVKTLYDNNVTNYTNDTLREIITGTRLQNIINQGYLQVYLYSYGYYSTNGQSATVNAYQKKSVSWAAPAGTASGTVAVSGTETKSIVVDVTNLTVGDYTSYVLVHSNDPNTPTYSIPIMLTVLNQPDITVGAADLNYGQVYSTATVTDSVLIENEGCQNLTITGVSSNNSHFTPQWTSKTLTPGSSAWLHVDFTATTSGQETGVMTITSNDSTAFFSLSAEVVFAPVADFQYVVQNNCSGLTSFINESQNGSQYFWAFNDGYFSGDPNPTHTFERPGTYTVMLVTTNPGGVDTVYKTVNVNDVLYVNYSAPDTTQAGQIVQFIDSSLVPNSWQWFFGDGNNTITPSPQHTYAATGTYFVTLVVSNAANCSGSESRPIVITSGIGVVELDELDLRISPNPSSGLIHVETTYDFESVHILDATGRSIRKVPFNRTLDLSDLPASTYMLQFESIEHTAVKRIQLTK